MEKIFFFLFRASNSHILDKKKFDSPFFKAFRSEIRFHTKPGLSSPSFERPGPELKKKYVYIYIHAQVIQNCTTLSRTDIYNMNGKQQDFKRRKQKPGKRCVVMFITFVASFQLMKVCGENGLHLFEQKENLTVGHQVRVTFAATISQLTTTKEKMQK